MEFITRSQNKLNMASLFLFLSISSLLLSPPSLADSQTTTIPIPSGAIQREIKQQILATIPPNQPENTEPFLTSPSGKYTGYLLRRETAPGAGGFGNDFCYVQIQDTASGDSVWESECEPVSSANACSLVFCDSGLAVFEGSQNVWDTGAGSHNNFPATLELVDHGDMRVIDKDGELMWKASDNPRVNQGCGLPGSPGLASGSPPFVAPIGGVDNPPFGQQQPLYPSTGALPLAPASAPFVAPVAGGDDLPSGEQPPQYPSNGAPPPVAPEPASAPFVAPVAGGDDLPSGEQPPQYPSNGAPPPVAPAPAPLVAPVGGEDDLQSGEQPPSHRSHGSAFGQQLQGSNGVNQPLGGIGGQQPLVDNNPYDSGCSRKEGLIGILMVVVGQLVLYGL